MASLATLGSAELRKMSERELTAELADMTPLAIDRFRRMRKLKPEHEEALNTFLRQNPDKRLTADGGNQQNKSLKAVTKQAGKAKAKPATVRAHAEDDGYVKLWRRMRAWWDGVDLEAETRAARKSPRKKNMEIEVDDTATLLAQRMDIIQQLQSNRPHVVRLFDNMVRTIPDGLFLLSLNRTNAQIAIEGKAESNTRVSKFMRNIESSDWLANPLLNVIQADENSPDSVIAFTLQANQVKKEP